MTQTKRQWILTFAMYLGAGLVSLTALPKPAAADEGEARRGCYCNGFECDNENQTPNYPYDRWCCENWMGTGGPSNNPFECSCNIWITNCIDGEQ